MNDMPCMKQVRSPALRFHGDLIRLMAETCWGFIPTCQCQEAPNVSFGNWPEMGKVCGPNSPFLVKLFGFFDHFLTPWELEVLTYNGTPLQYSCLENPMDGGAWKAAVHGVAESQTRLSNFTFTFHFHTLEREMATHSSVLAWRIPGTGSLMGCCLWGRTESDTTEVTSLRGNVY